MSIQFTRENQMNRNRYTLARPQFQGFGLSRRDALASVGALALAASTIAAMADEPPEPSELTRLIEAHRASEAALTAAHDALWDIEEEHGYGNSKAPGFAEAHASHKLASASRDVVFGHLLSYRPTSFAEVRQLIDHLTSDDCYGTTFVPNEREIGLIFAALSTSGAYPYA